MRKILYRFLLLIGVIALPVAYAFNTLSLAKPWARATVAGQKTSAAYMELESQDATWLVKVESPVARRAELHSMSMENGVMKMRKLKELPLPARTTVKLEPGGNHIMLFDLKQPLKAGDDLTLKLTLRNADKKTSVVQVIASVRADAPK